MDFDEVRMWLWSTRRAEAQLFCLWSNAFLHFFCEPRISRQRSKKMSAEFSFRPYTKTYCKTPAAFKILTKHIVFPRRRSKCEIYSTSAAPLLVIAGITLKLS